MKLYFDEFTVDEFGAWGNLCDKHIDDMKKMNQNTKNVTENAGEGICSIKDCYNNATAYINFNNMGESE